MDFKSADELFKNRMTVEEAKQTLKSYDVIYEEYIVEKRKANNYQYKMANYHKTIESILNKDKYIKLIREFIPYHLENDLNILNTPINQKYIFEGALWKKELFPEYFEQYNTYYRELEIVNSITFNELNEYNAEIELQKYKEPETTYDGSIICDEHKKYIYEVYTLFSNIYKTCLGDLESFNEHAGYVIDTDFMYTKKRKKILMEVLNLFKSLKYSCTIKKITKYNKDSEDEDSEDEDSENSEDSHKKEIKWKICISV